MAKFWCSGSVEATTFVALPYAELADVMDCGRPEVPTADIPRIESKSTEPIAFRAALG